MICRNRPGCNIVVNNMVHRDPWNLCQGGRPGLVKCDGFTFVVEPAGIGAEHEDIGGGHGHMSAVDIRGFSRHDHISIRRHNRIAREVKVNAIA